MVSTLNKCECGNYTINPDLCDDCIDTTPFRVKHKSNDVDADFGFPILVRGQRLVQVY